MLEGLQSSDGAVRCLTQSWVRAAIAKGSGEGMHKLLQPLVKILLESDSKRKPKLEKLSSAKITLTREDAERDTKYAKYYFESLGIENPYTATTKEQYEEILLQYTQVFDASQILYALSLLQLMVSVDPSEFILAIGNTVIDVSVYTQQQGTPHMQQHQYQHSADSAKSQDDTTTPQTPVSFTSMSTQKSLLEVVLSVCVDLLRSEYHPALLKFTASEQLENLRVKVSSASLLSTLLDELLKILAQHGDNSGGASPGDFKICSPNFVSALVTLCDIQKVALLLLGKSVEWWMELEPSPQKGSKDDGDSRRRSKRSVWRDLAQFCQSSDGVGEPSVELKSLYTQILRVAQCLVALDTQISQSLRIETTTPTATTPSSSSQASDLVTVVSGVHISSSPLPAVLPGCATASQPFFRNFLLLVLSDLSLSCFHDNLLHMFTSTISNLLNQQLTELAPKVVKQLCGNIGKNIDPGKKGQSAEGLVSSKLCVTYFDSILKTTTWCFFGDSISHSLKDDVQQSHRRSDFKLHHRSLNPFFDIIRVKQVDGAKESLTPTSKQPSTVAWLLGVFSAQKSTSGGADSESVSNSDIVGTSSQAGQHITMLLPAVYNSMTDLWMEFESVKGHSASGGGGVVVRLLTTTAGGHKSNAIEGSGQWKQSMIFEVCVCICNIAGVLISNLISSGHRVALWTVPLHSGRERTCHFLFIHLTHLVAVGELPP